MSVSRPWRHSGFVLSADSVAAYGWFLVNETDAYFLWQYDLEYPCPASCSKTTSGSSCIYSSIWYLRLYNLGCLYVTCT